MPPINGGISIAEDTISGFYVCFKQVNDFRLTGVIFSIG
jgi:hypothetical protein